MGPSLAAFGCTFRRLGALKPDYDYADFSYRLSQAQAAFAPRLMLYAAPLTEFPVFVVDQVFSPTPSRLQGAGDHRSFVA